MNQDNNQRVRNIENNINLYEDSLQKLQDIVTIMEDKETSFVDLVKNMNTANQLVEDCKAKLKGISKEIRKDD